MIVSVDVPVEVTVTVCVALLPTFTEPKLSDVAETCAVTVEVGEPFETDPVLPHPVERVSSAKATTAAMQRLSTTFISALPCERHEQCRAPTGSSQQLSVRWYNEVFNCEVPEDRTKDARRRDAGTVGNCIGRTSPAMHVLSGLHWRVETSNDAQDVPQRRPRKFQKTSKLA